MLVTGRRQNANESRNVPPAPGRDMGAFSFLAPTDLSHQDG